MPFAIVLQGLHGCQASVHAGRQACDEEKLLGHLGVVLYEYLGEEYPEVLGSILGALKSIVNVIGMTKARAVQAWFRSSAPLVNASACACE